MKKSLSALLLVTLFMVASLFGTGTARSDEYLANQDEIKAAVEFTLSFEQAKELIQKHYRELKTDEEIRDFILARDIQRAKVNGVEFYYEGLESNLFYRDPELVKREPEWSANYASLVNYLLDTYNLKNLDLATFKPEWSPYFNPKKYFIEYSIDVPRENLPDRGELKIWLPLPLQAPSQEELDIIELEPKEALVGAPITTGNIAYVMFKFDLETLQEELKVMVKYTFKHYQQDFDIDPGQVGTYDTDSELYRVYTKSAGSIFYDERFEKLAREIVEEETNPYLQAEKIYYYVVQNINYSFIAHVALEANKIPESFFAFEHGYGDCGTQSIFFAALCRSIGIPARTPGGFQVFSGALGSHFWAEFYLPNYGWVPVDTSAGQIANYTLDITARQRSDFIDYFFANQDPLRLIVQNTVDVMPAEKPEDRQLLAITMQSPFLESEFGNEDLSVTGEILQGFKIKTITLR